MVDVEKQRHNNNNVHLSCTYQHPEHLIHINLNMIFYTHVERSPTKTIYIKYYIKQMKKYQNKTKNALQVQTHACTHTHTHKKKNDCSGNWVLILGWKYCEKRKVFSLALKDDRVEQCLRSCGSEFQMWGPKQEKV